jgi:hypothetical protein
MIHFAGKGGAHDPTQGEDRIDGPQKSRGDIETSEPELFLDTPLRDERNDAIATYHTPLAAHRHVLIPAVPKEIGPDIECCPNGEGRRKLHSHCRRDGEQAPLLSRANPLYTVDVYKARGDVGGALQVIEALKVERYHHITLQELERVDRAEIIEAEGMEALVFEYRIGEGNIGALKCEKVRAHDRYLRPFELH